MGPSSGQVGRMGVHWVARLVVGELGRKFREQHASGWGIDAIIELSDENHPASRLITLRIKRGDTHLNRLRRAGTWPQHEEKCPLLRWLEYPTVVLYTPYTRGGPEFIKERAHAAIELLTPKSSLGYVSRVSSCSSSTIRECFWSLECS